MAKRRRDDDDYVSRASRGRSKGGSPRPAVPGRGTVACLQCRTRKSTCSLTGPACEGCQHRGEGDACSFQALLWIDNPEDLPSRQLKRKLDRLEELMQSISADTAGPPLAAPSPALAPAPSPAPCERPRASSAPVPGGLPTSQPSAAFGDVARDRAVDTLTRRILGGNDVPELGSLGLDSVSLSATLRRIEHEEAPNPPLPFYAMPTPASLHASVSPEEYERTVAAVMPTLAQAQLCLSAFFALANPLFRLVHAPTFLAECDTFWRTRAMPEPAWLGTYLVASGLGLMLSPDTGAANQHVVPSGPAKELLARTWVDAGRRVLANDALVQPTVESTRTFCLLLMWWMVEGGRYLEASLALSANIVSGLFDLQLNRDPSEVAPHLSPVEANLRRRLFWTLYAFESIARPMLGKSWQPFDESEISVEFPADWVAGEADAADSLPAAHAQAGVLNFRISKALTTRKGTSQEEVAQILDELDQFLEVHGDDAFVAAAARYSYQRLHRFAARAGFTTDVQDRHAAKHLGDLFSSVASAEMRDPAAAPFILLRILAAAITLAVDLNGMPLAFADTTPNRRELSELVHFVSTRAMVPKVTSMARRAVAVIEHLVHRPGQYHQVLLGPAFGPASTSDVSLASSSELPTPSTASTAPEDFKAHSFSDPPVYHPQHFFVEQLAPPSPPVENAPQPRAALMGPPLSSGPMGTAQPFRTSRPALSLFTTVAPPASSTKALTPLAVSPWIDAAITPSRYAGDFLWPQL